MEEITLLKELSKVCTGKNFGKMVVILFYADWNEHSMNYLEQFQSLLELSPIQDVVFAKCDAEKVPEVADKFQIKSIPSVVVTETRKKLLHKFENEAPIMLLDKLSEVQEEFKQNFLKEKEIMYKKINIHLSKPGIMVYFTGTATEPECGFTRQLVDIFKNLQIKFDFYNINADEDMLQWIRHYSTWPTFPQIFINGKLLGGLDVFKQHMANGTLEIPPESKISDPKNRLESILDEQKAILFLEGMPNDETISAQSKQMIKILRETGIKFTSFDLNIDSNLKQYIENNFSKSLPVFFAKQKFVGDLNAVEQLSNKSELLQTVPGSEWVLNGEQKIKYLIQTCPVLLFINGTPNDIKTKESEKLIKHFQSKNKLFEFMNVDADEEVKSSLKQFSGKDTLPLVYHEGKLVGGLEEAEKHFN